MITMIDSAIQQSQIYYTRLSNWKSKADLHLHVGPYVLQIARNKTEVLDCFKLRHQVFFVEMANNPKKSKLDFDQYDSFCDHLIIRHEPTGQLVGTYRMNFSKYSNMFYTASEFDMAHWIQNQKSSFIELGRACIKKEHRRGLVISLLFRGLIENMNQMGAEKLIGCSSIKVHDARSAALVFKYFENTNSLSAEIFKPQNKYEMKDLFFWLMVFSNGLTESQIHEAEEKIPSLLKLYIKAGAKICSYPAYDEELNCIDFVTIISRSEMDQKLTKKFNA